jgi:hypothetical protein
MVRYKVSLNFIGIISIVDINIPFIESYLICWKTLKITFILLSPKHPFSHTISFSFVRFYFILIIAIIICWDWETVRCTTSHPVHSKHVAKFVASGTDRSILAAAPVSTATNTTQNHKWVTRYVRTCARRWGLCTKKINFSAGAVRGRAFSRRKSPLFFTRRNRGTSKDWKSTILRERRETGTGSRSCDHRGRWFAHYRWSRSTDVSNAKVAVK